MRNPRAAFLRDGSQDTLSECWETAYERLSQFLNHLRITRNNVDAAEARQENGQKMPVMTPKQSHHRFAEEAGKPVIKDID